jgi:hypothetical protein
VSVAVEQQGSILAAGTTSLQSPASCTSAPNSVSYFAPAENQQAAAGGELATRARKGRVITSCDGVEAQEQAVEQQQLGGAPAAESAKAAAAKKNREDNGSRPTVDKNG